MSVDRNGHDRDGHGHPSPLGGAASASDGATDAARPSIAPSDRRIFLGQPGYGEVTAGAARGFYRASRLPDADEFPDYRAPGGRVYRQYNEGSLLASNFNQLWCRALNFAVSGRRVDYFGMIHADIEPEDWWLDTLIDEMEAKSLDVLGVVAPIKDQRGVTSIALDHPSGDPWRKTCRLTLHEVHRLPETFTSEDVGYPVLLNTGLWACRFDPAWARMVHFEINDRIVRNPDGTFAAQNESEDWYFSRLLHEIGAPGSPSSGSRPLRIGCTRKVQLMHRGPMHFTNRRAWGTDEFDRAILEKSVIPDDPEHPDWRFPAEVVGWLSPAEGRTLARLARGRRVLEVGSYYGRSTICLAQAADRVVAVDTHDGRGTPEPRDTLGPLRQNLGRYGVAEKVSVRVGRLYRDECYPADERFDLIFVDGDHARQAVEHDILCSIDRLAPGGLIAFHDYDNGVDPGVKDAVDDLVAAGGELLSVTDTLAVIRPPASIPLELEV